MNDIYNTGIHLWAQWFKMWNGQPALARELAAERFQLHLPLPSLIDAATVTDPSSVEQWVTAHRARFSRLTFHPGEGPFVDVRAGAVSGPWTADVLIGNKVVLINGMDTLAFRDGKVTEYWTLSKEVDVMGRWGEVLGPVQRRL